MYLQVNSDLDRYRCPKFLVFIQMLLMELMELIDFGIYVIYPRESLSVFSGGMTCNIINTNQGGSFLPFMCRSVFGVQKSPNECLCSGVLYLILHLEADFLNSDPSCTFSGLYFSFGLHS